MGCRDNCGTRQRAGEDTTIALKAGSLEPHKPAQGLALENLSKTRTENKKNPSKAVETISCSVNYCQHYK